VLTPTQTSLLSGISAFSILTLDVGRIDWFLVLLSQLASVISCATYVYCATDCINELTGKKNYFLCVVASVAILYAADLLLFGNIDYGLFVFKKYTRYLASIVQTIIPLICLLCAIIYRLKCRKFGNIDANYTQNVARKRKNSTICLNNSANLAVLRQKHKNCGGKPC
jgi:hypothetical protein